MTKAELAARLDALQEENRHLQAWAFIDECLEPRIPSVTDSFEDQGINETELYLAYKAYTVAVGKPPMSRDGFVHELRQVLPLNWVDRRSGGKVKRRFVYIRLRPAFEFGEFGATCNMEARGYDGVLQFREWSASYGAMHPYDPGDLEAMATPTEPHHGIVVQVSGDYGRND